MDKNFYVYGITHRWFLKKYIGSRGCFCDPKEDIGIKYFSFSSDKKFKEEQRLHPERFIYEVLIEFDTREEAVAYEIELHARYNVKDNNDFYNLANQTSTGFCISEEKATELALKRQADIRADPNKVKSISKKLSIAVTRIQQEFRSNPIMYEERSRKMREAHAILKKDTVRAEERKRKIGEANSGINHGMSKPVYKLDPITKKVLETFDYCRLAAKTLGLNEGNLAHRAKTEVGLCGGFAWRY